MKKLLVTYAVKEEYFPISIPGYSISYLQTTIGKAKSAMKLTKAIMSDMPDLVLNIGTAGTLTHKVGDVFVCSKFIDRDYIAVKLPGVEYEIDTSKLASSNELALELLNRAHKKGICSTGDTFVTEPSLFGEDVVDMESYAQALVCTEFNIPFVSVKYVTDIIGQNSIAHWEEKLADARKGLAAWFGE